MRLYIVQHGESDENEKSDPNIIQNFARNAEKFTVIARFC